MKVVGFAGFSGSGKTTLIEQLIPVLRSRGLRVSVVKHAHHRFDIDHPGKDSYRHRQAGAFEVVVASSHRLALLREFEQPLQLSVHHLIAELDEHMVAIATDSPGLLPQATLLPVLDVNDPEALANWLLAQQDRFDYRVENFA